MNALKHIIVTGAMGALALITFTLGGVAAAQDTKPTERVAAAAAAATEEVLADAGTKVLRSALAVDSAARTNGREIGRIGTSTEQVVGSMLGAAAGALVHPAILTPQVAALAVARDAAEVVYELAQQSRIEDAAIMREGAAEKAAADALALDLEAKAATPECHLVVVRSYGYDRDLQIRAISDLGLKDQTRSLSIDECGLAATLIGGQEAVIEIRELGWLGSRRLYHGSVSGLLEGEGRGLQGSIEPFACGSTATIEELEAILKRHCTER